MKTYVYINVTVLGTVNSVLSNLIGRVRESGLYDFCDGVYLIVNGDRSLLDVDLSGDKMNVVEYGRDISGYEFPTLTRLFEHSLEEEFRVLYMHTKGVSKGHPFIDDWTNLLAYFNVDRWKDRLLDLDSNDCTGVNYGGNPEDIKSHPAYWGYGKAPMHYSGNFWWSKSSHIKTLIHPIKWAPDENLARWRMMNEMWICSNSVGKYHCAYSSGVNHYVTPYPKEIYEIK